MLGRGAIIMSGSLGWLSACREAAPVLNLPDSLVDTIIPRDDYAGAIDLGLNNTLRAWLNEKPRRTDRFNILLEAINRRAQTQHQRPFNTLSIDHRETLLTDIMDRKSAGNNSDLLRTRSTLLHIRRQIMNEYYGSLEGQRSIDYQLPGLLRLKLQNNK